MSQNEPMDPGAKRRCLQHYRDMLGRAGFTVFGEEELLNGHAPFPHMAPWAYFLLPGGHVIRMGYLVSCIHLDYMRTTCREDLLPNVRNRTRGEAFIEVNEDEVQTCLECLYGYLYPKKKKE